LTHDAWGLVFPVLAMFLIRNRGVSFCFLAIFVLFSIQMFFQARSVYLGTYLEHDFKFGPLALFFAFSIVCLVVYAAFASVRFAIAMFRSTN
jgi:hypothetical protein